MYINRIQTNQSQSFNAVIIRNRLTVGPEDKEFYTNIRSVLRSKNYPKDMQVYRTRRGNSDYDYIYLFFGMQKKDEDTFVSLVQSQNIKAEQTDFFFIGKNRKDSLEKLEPKRKNALGLSQIELNNCEKINEKRHFF